MSPVLKLILRGYILNDSFNCNLFLYTIWLDAKNNRKIIVYINVTAFQLGKIKLLLQAFLHCI